MRNKTWWKRNQTLAGWSSARHGVYSGPIARLYAGNILNIKNWLDEWKQDGQTSGLVNTVKKIEAIQMELSDSLKTE
ncbi:MAG: hypothetical protein Q4C49_12890 [Bacillota bacterium]|nr:hypothetical protein [Bacillota bacterium]